MKFVTQISPLLNLMCSQCQSNDMGSVAKCKFLVDLNLKFTINKLFLIKLKFFYVCRFWVQLIPRYVFPSNSYPSRHVDFQLFVQCQTKLSLVFVKIILPSASHHFVMLNNFWKFSIFILYNLKWEKKDVVFSFTILLCTFIPLLTSNQVLTGRLNQR